jgi:SAM-dependent MidA family methyltransferase
LDPLRSPLLLVANEFFDALPVRQFVETASATSSPAAGGFAFDRDGRSLSVRRSAKLLASGKRLTADGGAAILIDYGLRRSEQGDTLQPVRESSLSYVLDHPGRAEV